MVRLMKTAECINGEHDKCNGGSKVPPGNFGGEICTCHCHHEYKVEPVYQTRVHAGDEITRLQTALSAAVAERDRLLESVKLAYRKHHMDDPAIGWEELDTKLYDALCSVMGDGNFCKWLETV